MPVTESEKTEILLKLIEIMKKYKGPLAVSKDSNNGLELIGNVKTLYGSKNEEVPGMYFASTNKRADSVAFYFFPIYSEPESFIKLAPNTIKLLKGKTCFHLKKITDINETEIKKMFEAGIRFYKKQGWIK